MSKMRTKQEIKKACEESKKQMFKYLALANQASYDSKPYYEYAMEYEKYKAETDAYSWVLGLDSSN